LRRKPLAEKKLRQYFANTMTRMGIPSSRDTICAIEENFRMPSTRAATLRI